jgi:hypothetical protein
MRPEESIKVTEAEFLDLERQGLIKKDETPKETK